MSKNNFQTFILHPQNEEILIDTSEIAVVIPDSPRLTSIILKSGNCFIVKQTYKEVCDQILGEIENRRVLNE